MSLPTTLASALALLLFALNLSGQDDLGEIFTSGSGGFSIATPGGQSGRSPIFFSLGKDQLTGDVFFWRSDEEFTSVEVYRVFSRVAKLSEVQKKALIDLYKREVLQKTGRAGDDYTERPYVFLGSTGIELKGGLAVLTVIRVLFLNERLIVLSTASRNDRNFEIQLELLDSFRMLSKQQHISVLIRENTPPTLPQELVDTSIPNDLAQTGLKGNVTEVEEKFQATEVAEKELLKSSVFNPKGNLVKEISFLGGYPNQVRVWGWIDRKRVSSSTTINYRADTHLDPNRPKMSVDGGGLAYGLRYEAKFDDLGRVAERKVSSSGSTSYREKFTYSSGGIDKQVFDGSGGFLSRTFEVLDPKGNVTEERTLDNAGRSAGTQYFEYEFDVKGNWIAKRVYIKTGRNFLRKLTGIYTRTIKYE